MRASIISQFILKTLSIILAVLIIGVPRTESTVLQESDSNKIFKAANSSLGKQMWNGYGLRDGTLGCAASLSNILNKGGVKVAHSASVAAVRKQMLSTGKFRELVLRNGEGDEIDEVKLKSMGKPGDVVLAFMRQPDRDNSGPSAHCGILGAQSNIYTNDWNDGVWKQLNIHIMFDHYPYIRLVRPRI